MYYLYEMLEISHLTVKRVAKPVSYGVLCLLTILIWDWGV